MEMDSNKPHCPILDVDGVISGGKQFDLDIILQEDNRDVIRTQTAISTWVLP